MEQQQSMKDDALVTCPKCHTDSLFRVITGGNGFFLSGRTIGIIAEKNDTAFSAELKKNLKEKSRKRQDVLTPHLQDGASITPKTEEKPTPQFYDSNRTATDDQLRKASPASKKKYIETGKL